MTKDKYLSITDISYNPENGLFYKSQNSDGAPSITENLRADGYKTICIKRTNLYSHRVAWALFYKSCPTMDVDHINGDRSDNRIVNLRLVSHQTNTENRRLAQKNNKSGILGVSWHKGNGKWVAQVYLNRKRVFCKYCDDKESAHSAYIEAKRIYHAGCTI